MDNERRDKRYYFRLYLSLAFIIVPMSLVAAVPAVAADPTTIASSTMVFESGGGYPLTYDSVTGTYSGMIPMVATEPTGYGDGVPGYDIYAEEGASAWFGDNPGTGPVWTEQVISGHNAWPGWDPNTPDWYQYSLKLYEESGVQKWRVANHSGATEASPWYMGGGSGAVEQGVPMSGSMDWTNMYAVETDVGVYLPPLDVNHGEIPGGAAAHGGGPMSWDMDWSWGSEVVPLQYPGFSVEVIELGDSDYRVILTPALPSYGFVTGGGWFNSPEGAVPAREEATFFNGFEVNTAGWFDIYLGDLVGPITRVASGTNGVVSADGSWHAEVELPICGDGPWTEFGGYSSVFPAGGFSQFVDVYIDPAMGNVGYGWALDNALTGSDGNWEEAGGVGALKVDGGNWWLAADGDGAGYPGPATGGQGLEVDTAGWYTIESQWVENIADPTQIDRNTFIYDSNGTLLYSHSNLQQVALADAGGNRYGWFLDSECTSFPMGFVLPIDNSRLVQLVSPTGRASFGFVAKYKKGASVPDGQTEFVFKAGDLNFHSSSYDWLVVTGSNFAKFKGIGTINGEGEYKFQLWAGDNDPDTFRIKIWEGGEDAVYDNGMNQPIGGGNIVIHTSKK